MMNIFLAICVLASFPMIMTLNCYQCAAGSGGCSDPFNKTGSGVSTTGSDNNYGYCKKKVVLGVALRTGEMTCEDSKFVLNSGTTCCQRDLCNTGHIHYPISFLLIISFILTKFTSIQ